MANEEKNEPIIAVAEVSGEELLDDAMDTVVTEEYGADQIQVLEGLEAVRKRPGMYIGSTGPRGLHHLVYEIVDNSIDEALAGFCTHIEVEILPGNIISVRDNGRGIPVATHEKMGIPTLTVVLTVLHAGGKFGGIGLTQSFALELVSDRIKVNSVCPGNFFDGPLWSNPERGLFVQYLNSGKVPGARTIEDVKRFYEAKVPMNRGCFPADVAKAILYSVEQKYETGQAIPVTGGQVMLK